MESSAVPKTQQTTVIAISPYARLATIRRWLQIGVLVFFFVLPVAYARRLTDLHGSLYAMDFWGLLVMDPVIAVQKTILGEGSWKFLLGIAIPVVLAFTLGPVFCGWMCPFGLLSGMGARLRPGRSRAPGEKIAPPWRGRYAILVGVFIAGTAIHYPLATRLSMPGALTLSMSAAVASEILIFELWIVAGVLLLDFLIPRFWCNHFCMQGALLSLLRLPGTLRVHYDERGCRREDCGGNCYAVCPIGIDPRSLGRVSGCTNCGVCLTACARNGGALAFTFGERGKSKMDNRHSFPEKGIER